MSDRVHVWKLIDEGGELHVYWMNFDRERLPSFVGWRVMEWTDNYGERCIFMAPGETDDATFSKHLAWAMRASEIPF